MQQSEKAVSEPRKVLNEHVSTTNLTRTKKDYFVVRFPEKVSLGKKSVTAGNFQREG